MRAEVIDASPRQRVLPRLRVRVHERSAPEREYIVTMLANLFDLDSVSVDDVMTPRNHIEALDLSIKPSLLAQQLATSYHTRLPV